MLWGMSNKLLVTAFSSAARTASPSDAVVEVPTWANRATVIVNTTAVTSTPSTVFNVRGRVPGTATDYLMLASAAVATVTVTPLLVGIGVVAVANAGAQAGLPYEIVIDPVHGNANSHTYTVQILFTE